MLRSTRIATLTSFLTSFFHRMMERVRLTKMYPTMRNRIVKRAGTFVISGYLLAHGFILIAILLFLIGLIAEEV